MSGLLDVFALVLTMIGVVASVVSMVRGDDSDPRALQVALACGTSAVLALIVVYASGSA